MLHVSLWPAPTSLSLWWVLREDTQIDSIDRSLNFSIAAVGWCESHLISSTKLLEQSACWHISFKLPKLLQAFSSRMRPLVYFQQVIWHCACELHLIYMQENGNKKLGLTRSVSKSIAVSVGLCSLTSKHQAWGLPQSYSSNIIVSIHTHMRDHSRFLDLMDCHFSLSPSHWKGAF